MTSAAQPLPAEFAFPPDAQRAERLDADVRDGLAESLADIFDALEIPADDRRRAALMRALAAGPVSPGLFALYIELGLAIYEERDEEACALAEALLGAPTAAPAPLSVATLDDRDLGPGQAARYARLLADDIGVPIAGLSPDDVAAASHRLEPIFHILRQGAPEVLAESAALVRQIVLVAPDKTAGHMPFGAASSFALWGALVLNVQCLDDPLHAAEQLAHETTHTMLFGAARGGLLTANAEGERYNSPLRRDPRPMEGVAHATYVAGRMVYLLDRLLAAGALSAEQAAAARRALESSRGACSAGLATVATEAQLTPAGAAAFAGLRRFVGERTDA